MKFFTVELIFSKGNFDKFTENVLLTCAGRSVNLSEWILKTADS